MSNYEFVCLALEKADKKCDERREFLLKREEERLGIRTVNMLGSKIINNFFYDNDPEYAELVSLSSEIFWWKRRMEHPDECERKLALLAWVRGCK
jgi:hypothetical protein